MKVIIYVFFFWIFVLILRAQIGDYNSAENKKWWNGEHHYKLHLSNAPLTLQECLDQGIRPRHVPGLAGHTLHFQAKKFELALPNGESVFGENGYGRIRVSKDYQVTSVVFYEEAFVGFEKCRERLIESNQAYSGVILATEIDEFLDDVRVTEGHWTGEKQFGVGNTTQHSKKGEYWQSSLIAQNQGTEQMPFRFILRTEFRDNGKPLDYKKYHRLGALLAPPEGYEHVSFTYISPPKDPNAPLILTPEEQSKLLAEQLKKDAKKSLNLSQEPRTNKKLKPNLKPKVVAKKAPKPEKKSSFPAIIAGVLFVGILALLLKNIKGKSTS